MWRLPVALINAPSNLGLRPHASGAEPGTWRAAQAFEHAGLAALIVPETVVDLPRPAYDASPQDGTRLLNGHALRAFNETLADHVEGQLHAGRFPLVVGGDCGILLGCLAGARRLGRLSLVHMDGHSDFRHPGNYDPAAALGAVAGMDLALATGRGEPLMTAWNGSPEPLVADTDVVQVGERENRNADYAWPDVLTTAITQIDIFWIKRHGTAAAMARIRGSLASAGHEKFWVHMDVDVLDERIMPAVDSPGRPGLEWTEARQLLAPLLDDPACLGLDVTVFDPELDPDTGLARALTALIGQCFDA